MSLISTLHLAIEVATRKRDIAGQALARAQQQEIAARQQLEQLEQYGRETDARWAAQGQVCVLPELMHHHHQFMGRLDQAIGVQRGAVADQERWVERARQALVQADLRVATLQQVLRRKQDEADLVRQRREQRQMDEIAAVRFARTARQLRDARRGVEMAR